MRHAFVRVVFDPGWTSAEPPSPSFRSTLCAVPGRKRTILARAILENSMPAYVLVALQDRGQKFGMRFWERWEVIGDNLSSDDGIRSPSRMW